MNIFAGISKKNSIHFEQTGFKNRSFCIENIQKNQFFSTKNDLKGPICLK